MLTASRKCVAIAVGVLGCAAVGGTLLLYRWHRPFQSAKTGATPEVLTQLPADAPIIAYIDVAAWAACAANKTPKV